MQMKAQILIFSFKYDLWVDGHFNVTGQNM